jgi:hypothetical protein
MKHPGTLAPWLAAASVVALLAGCDSGTAAIPVTGRLLQDGQPLQVSTEGMPPGSRPIQIIFHAVPGAGQARGESFYGKVDSDTGEFTVPGPAGRGIPPGKYRISVVVLSAPGGPPGPGASGERLPGPPGVGIPPEPGGGTSPSPAGVLGMSDRLGGVFSPERSTLEVEITRPSEVILDVGSHPAATVQ